MLRGLDIARWVGHVGNPSLLSQILPVRRGNPGGVGRRTPATLAFGQQLPVGGEGQIDIAIAPKACIRPQNSALALVERQGQRAFEGSEKRRIGAATVLPARIELRKERLM